MPDPPIPWREGNTGSGMFHGMNRLLWSIEGETEPDRGQSTQGPSDTGSFMTPSIQLLVGVVLWSK